MTPLRIGAVLSLTGRFSRFGLQAEQGLRAWAALTAGVQVVVEDDAGDPGGVRKGLRRLLGRCDIALGPYSTVLARVAGEIAVETGTLVWNHGGSGDDVQTGSPGHLVSVLSPTSSYAESFVRYLSGLDEPAPLHLVQGRGSFGRQVIAGAEAAAERAGLTAVRADPDGDPPTGLWDLFTAGTFEHDLDVLAAAARLASGPRHTGSVAAGVQEFAGAAGATESVFGVAQWTRGVNRPAQIGPTEEEFVLAYGREGSAALDYPAVQIAAAAALATHCVRSAGGTVRSDVLDAAANLRTSTLFGDFAVDPLTGRQLAHRMALVRWTDGVMRPIG